jgi:hypothetical protein
MKREVPVKEPPQRNAPPLEPSFVRLLSRQKSINNLFMVSGVRKIEINLSLLAPTLPYIFLDTFLVL